MANRRRRKPKYWTEGGIDIPFLAMVIALVVIGLLMMFSASTLLFQTTTCLCHYRCRRHAMGLPI